MDVFFNPVDIEKLNDFYIVVDTNILHSMFTNPEFLGLFFQIFSNNTILIDPIIKLEFLRGAYAEDLLSTKMQFLELDQFSVMADHQEIFKRVNDGALTIARINSHTGNSAIPLGDMLIQSRLMQYKDHCLFLTKDKGDFSTILFDRKAVISVEFKNKQGRLYLEHLVLLEFNHRKFDECVTKLPKKMNE